MRAFTAINQTSWRRWIQTGLSVCLLSGVSVIAQAQDDEVEPADIALFGYQPEELKKVEPVPTIKNKIPAPAKLPSVKSKGSVKSEPSVNPFRLAPTTTKNTLSSKAQQPKQIVEPIVRLPKIAPSNTKQESSPVQKSKVKTTQNKLSEPPEPADIALYGSEKSKLTSVSTVRRYQSQPDPNKVKKRPFKGILISSDPPVGDGSKPNELGDGRVPEDSTDDLEEQSKIITGVPRYWALTDLHWEASKLAHDPLYFEDATLERYGHTHRPLVQPFISGAKFFGTLPLLPYKIALDRRRGCIYTLGYYRPGSCAPRLRDRLPIRIGPSIVEGATIAGLILLIP